jgi:PTH1 family peptidyl-tRNA hydrolase
MAVLYVGLGNPGEQYEKTRHNVGFIFIDKFAEYLHVKSWQSKFNGLITATDNDVFGKVILLKPQTFMNSSGMAVAACMNFFKIPPELLVVIHDDLELAFADCKIKNGGSHRGHNGVRDIHNAIHTSEYTRVRIGIDKPVDKNLITDYVISNFSAHAMQEMLESIDDLISGRNKIFVEAMQKKSRTQ